MNINLSQYKITVLRPGGNDTALVEGIVKKSKRKLLNDLIMQSFPNVEQVGFYEYDRKSNTATLEMAGGEFCGNATRSLAYLLLNGKKGEMRINVSGTTKALKAGVKNQGTAFSYMPIYGEFNSVEKINDAIYKVEMEGITHLITAKPVNSAPNEIKNLAKGLLNKYDLLYSRLASGFMFISENKKNNSIFMEPIVWVRDIKTLFYETACASGTTAVGLWKSTQDRRPKTQLNITQPSGEMIRVTVEKDSKTFISAVIDGSVSLLEEKV